MNSQTAGCTFAGSAAKPHFACLSKAMANTQSSQPSGQVPCAR